MVSFDISFLAFPVLMAAAAQQRTHQTIVPALSSGGGWLEAGERSQYRLQIPEETASAWVKVREPSTIRFGGEVSGPGPRP
jgi:hypothetical protein